MKKLLRPSESFLFSGRLMRRWRRRYENRCVHILTYHSIGRDPCIFTDGTALRHPPGDFERQVDYFCEHYRPVSLRAVAEAARRNEHLERAIVFTFDDGYADNLRRAYPILFRRRIPMTIFPVAGVIGNTDLMWQHKLAWLTRNGHEGRINIALEHYGYPARDEHETWPDYARRCFRPDLPDILEHALRDVGESGASLAGRFRPYLEPEEMAAADPEFVEFGNHTMTHPVLSALSAEAQQREIASARDCLTAITGIAPTSFAYPFGLKRQYDDDSLRIVRETGHTAAVDMRRRINVGRMDPFQLSRRPAPHGPVEEMDSLIDSAPANAFLAPTDRA